MAGTLTFDVVSPDSKTGQYVLTLHSHIPDDWDEQSIKEDIQGGVPIFKDIGPGAGRMHQSIIRINASTHDDLRTAMEVVESLRQATGSVAISLHGWTESYTTMKLSKVSRPRRVPKNFIFYDLIWWET